MARKKVKVKKGVKSGSPQKNVKAAKNKKATAKKAPSKKTNTKKTVSKSKPQKKVVKRKVDKKSTLKKSIVAKKNDKIRKDIALSKPKEERQTKLAKENVILNRKKLDFKEPEVEIVKPLKVTVKSGPKKPEPKGKYVIEYSVRSSVGILFEFISTPSGLSEWFADNVQVQTGGFFTFFWDGVGQQAKIIGYKDQHSVKFEWVAKKDGSYFEFRIQTDELTGDVSLIVTDFSDPSELQTNKLVWNSQIDNLLHIIGSYSP